MKKVICFPNYALTLLWSMYIYVYTKFTYWIFWLWNKKSAVTIAIQREWKDLITDTKYLPVWRFAMKMVIMMNWIYIGKLICLFVVIMKKKKEKLHSLQHFWIAVTFKSLIPLTMTNNYTTWLPWSSYSFQNNLGIIRVKMVKITDILKELGCPP